MIKSWVDTIPKLNLWISIINDLLQLTTSNIYTINGYTDKITVTTTFDETRNNSSFDLKIPVPLETPSYLGMDRENNTHVFTPSRAYFKDIDLETSPFKVYSEFNNMTYSGKHNY